MTAIGSILKSCFNPRRAVFWILIIWIVTGPTSIFAMLKAAQGSLARTFLFALFWPFFSFGFSIWAVGLHLRQTLLEAEEADMLPNYHVRQLTAAGIIILTCLLVFLALTLYCGRPPVPALAGLLFVTAMTLWFGSNFHGGVMVLFYLPLITAKMFFPDSTTNRVLTEAFQTVWTSISTHENAWSGILIILSLGGIIKFCLRYLEIPCAAALTHRFFMVGFFGSMQLVHQYAPHRKIPASEEKNLWINKTVEKAVSRMTTARHEQPPSFFQLMRLTNITMLGIPINHNSGRICCVIAGLMITFMSYFFGPNFPAFFVTLPLMCTTLTSHLIFNFQSNKSQLPMLYIQTDLPSKSAFMKMVSAGYLWLIAELVLVLIGTALAAHVFFPSIAWPRVFQAASITASIALVQSSLSLLTGNRRKTPPGPGWFMKNSFLWTLAAIIPLCVPSWIVPGIFAIAGVSVLCVALRRWTKSEMDCA